MSVGGCSVQDIDSNFVRERIQIRENIHQPSGPCAMRIGLLIITTSRIFREFLLRHSCQDFVRQRRYIIISEHIENT